MIKQQTNQGKRSRRTEEDDVQTAIIELCLRLGFLVFHDNDPRRNRAGFPDLIIVGYGVLLVIELKTDLNEATAEQRRWIDAFIAAGVDARIYRTSSWKTYDLATELRTIKKNWTLRLRAASRKPPAADVIGATMQYNSYARNRNVDDAFDLADRVPELLTMITYLQGQLDRLRTVTP